MGCLCVEIANHVATRRID